MRYGVLPGGGVALFNAAKTLQDAEALIEDPSERTMAGALGAFQGHYATNVSLLCAGTILILLPTLIIFVLFQRQIIAALLQGSVKG